jgi:hypothetical protein
VAIWCRCFIRVFTSFFFGVFSFSSSLIGCSWIAPLTLDILVMRGLSCQLVVLSVYKCIVLSGFFHYVRYLRICHGSR